MTLTTEQRAKRASIERRLRRAAKTHAAMEARLGPDLLAVRDERLFAPEGSMKAWASKACPYWSYRHVKRLIAYAEFMAAQGTRVPPNTPERKLRSLVVLSEERLDEALFNVETEGGFGKLSSARVEAIAKLVNGDQSRLYTAAEDDDQGEDEADVDPADQNGEESDARLPAPELTVRQFTGEGLHPSHVDDCGILDAVRRAVHQARVVKNKNRGGGYAIPDFMRALDPDRRAEVRDWAMLIVLVFGSFLHDWADEADQEPQVAWAVAPYGEMPFHPSVGTELLAVMGEVDDQGLPSGAPAPGVVLPDIEVAVTADARGA